VPQRVAGSEHHSVAGTAAQAEKFRRRWQGGPGVSNTASVERLNTTFGECLASLTRRGRVLARCTTTVHAGRYLIGTFYNFCTYHTTLSQAVAGARTPLTPAMVAALTDPRWTVQQLRLVPVPPLRWTPPTWRGRPSRALQRVVKRWCA